MGPRDDILWADKYRNSDHHTDRRVRTIVSYESKTGLKFPEPPPKHIANNCKMTWGKGGSTNVVQVTTKSRRAASVPAADVEYEPTVGSKTARAVYSAMNDANDLSLASKRQDQRLLNDIQIRMHKLEFDSVKPGYDVKMKTGFRRFIYGNKPALEKETVAERRKDQLRYPWASRDNIYRPPRKANREGRLVAAATAEQTATDHYPRHDPLGLYGPREKVRPRPKSWHPESLGDAARPVPRSTSALLARLHAKTRSYAADASDERDDIAGFLDELSRPLPRSSPVDFYVPATGGEYQFVGDVQLDADTARKFRSGREEIDEFDRLLDATFPERPPTADRRPRVNIPPTTPLPHRRRPLYSREPEPEDDVSEKLDYSRSA